MTRCFVYLSLAFTFSMLVGPSVQAADSVANKSGKVWQVRYDKTTPNRRGDIGVRLKIRRPDAAKPNLTATLVRFDRVNGANKYKRLGDTKFDLAGQITSNQNPASPNSRKPQQFTLIGTYFETKANGNIVPHLIVLQGQFSTGRDGKATGSGATPAEEGDNFISVRFTDKKLDASAAHWMLPGLLTGLLLEPCDELPPDEDVMTEEPIDGAGSDTIDDEATDPIDTP